MGSWRDNMNSYNGDMGSYNENMSPYNDNMNAFLGCIGSSKSWNDSDLAGFHPKIARSAPKRRVVAGTASRYTCAHERAVRRIRKERITTSMALDYSIHSDFLVHWTGKDLDCSYDPEWCEQHKSENAQQLTEQYLKRLYGILKYGLWLTSEREEEWTADGLQFTVPATPKTCFTELKLSECRSHARQYGRLGIGVKRPYLFVRCGRPLAYFGFSGFARHDHFLRSCAEDLKNRDLLNFFKPMNSSTSPLNYDLYSESEWRIIFLKQLLERHLLVDPRDPRNKEAYDYFTSLSIAEQAQLRYLAPLDGWFTLLIYPSIAVKNAARQNQKIRDEIGRIKSDPKDHANKVEGGNWPIEVDLGACRNF